ncbi:MAG: SIR2 family protein, partial [Candidatus Neomarinimicrobiota bacterium]
MEIKRTIQDVVDTLRNVKDYDKKCTLLIGAGCSVEAGIPLADDFVTEIKDRYSGAYDRAKDKSYPHCMAQLAPGERKSLIAKYVDNATINWAHVAMACLIKKGYVDRVLTTNFDSLIVRACAQQGIFPAVYDFAVSPEFRPEDIPERAIFYLHGQRSGFVQYHTPQEMKKLSKVLAPLFLDAGRGRVWIVVGYSGRNDPVFNQLAAIPRFDYNLYWVCYKDSEPAMHVYKGLLTQDKYAFYVQGYDADDFLAVLAQNLGCFPPDLIQKPFSYLEAIFNTLTPYKLPTQETESDVTYEAKEMIRECKAKYEAETEGTGQPEEVSRAVQNANALMMAGEYDKVIAIRERFEAPLPEKLVDLIAWAYVMQGVTLGEQAMMKTGADAERLFALAYEKFESALKIKPDKHEALNNWGFAISNQAEQKTGEEADRL